MAAKEILFDLEEEHFSPPHPTVPEARKPPRGGADADSDADQLDETGIPDPREPLFPEASSRTSSSPSAGWVELNTDDAFWRHFFGTDVTYCVSHKYLLLRCV